MTSNDSSNQETRHEGPEVTAVREETLAEAKAQRFWRRAYWSLLALCGLIALLVAVLLFVFREQVIFSGGSGTREDPFRIETFFQFRCMRYSMDKHFILTKDVGGADINDRRKMKPFGTFKGTLDGNGYHIRHVSVESDNTAGLFGVIAEGAEIKNLMMYYCFVEGYHFVGSFAVFNEGRIEQCAVQNVWLKGDFSNGGLVAVNKGTICNCLSRAGIFLRPSMGFDITGGIVGMNFGTIENCLSLSYIPSGTKEIDIPLVGFNPESPTPALLYVRNNANALGITNINGQVIASVSCYADNLEITSQKSAYPGWDFEKVWNLREDGKHVPGLRVLHNVVVP